MGYVRVKYFQGWNTSLSMLFGKSPKITMVCGNCNYNFSKRFEPIDFRSGYPKAMCPSCHTINEVPIVIKS